MKKYFLIIITMAVAYGFSAYAGNNIFVAYTPRVNRGYLADLQSQFRKNINNIYLAFSFKTGKTDYDNNIAVNNNKQMNTSKPKGTNNVNNLNNTTNTAMNGYNLKPETIPENLFKSVSKGVSAYEKTEDEGEGVILKIEKGTTYKVRDITLPNGKIVQIIDLSGQ